MKISSDASKHNTCYERLARSEMKKPEIWPVVTTPLYDHSVCRDASQQQYRQQCQIMKENQTGRKGILFHQFCCLCHSGWHKSGLGFSLLFQHFYKKKHCVVSWELLSYLMQEPGDLAALLLCNSLTFAVPNLPSFLNLLMILAIKILDSVWQLTICKRGHKWTLPFCAFAMSLIRFISSLRVLIKGIT